MNTLNVKRITAEQLSAKWTIDVRDIYKGERLYIQCNANGDVYWHKNSVYNDQELVDNKRPIKIQ